MKQIFKKSLLLGGLVLICSSVYANEKSFDVIAPTVVDNEDVPKQVGSIFYNLSEGSFYGIDNRGIAVPLSISTTNTGLQEASDTTASFANSTNWVNLAALSLAPGVWELSGSVIFKTGTIGTTGGDMLVAVSEYSANTTTDHVEGVNFFGTATNVIPEVRTMITIPKVTLTNSTGADKSYYFKLKKDNGGADLFRSYRVVAQKIK